MEENKMPEESVENKNEEPCDDMADAASADNSECESNHGKENDALKAKKKMSTFKKGIIIYSAVLVGLAIAALITLWVFLASFQKSQSDQIADEYLAEIQDSTWREFLAEGIYVGPYESKGDALEAAYSQLIKGKELNCNKNSAESTDDKCIYYVTNGKNRICNIVLIKDDAGSFGFDRWKVEGIEPIEGAFNSFTPYLSLVIPEGSNLSINGIKVEYSAENTSSYTLEYSTDSYISFNYRKPWSDNKVSAYYNGAELVSTNISGVQKLLNLPEEMISSYTVTVPSGSEVYLNDTRLSTDYIAASDCDYPFLSPLDKGNPDAPTATVYTVRSFGSDAEFKVLYDGKELDFTEGNNGEHYYTLPYDTFTYTVMAPADVTVTVNGIDVSNDAEYIDEDGIVYDAVSDYEELLKGAKRLRRYKFEGLLFIPEINVTDAEGTACPLTADSATDFSCTSAPPQAEIAIYDALAKDFCYAMMDYMFLGRDVVTDTMNAALSHTKTDSPAYDAIYGAYWGMYWRHTHTYVYNSLTVDNYISYSDNAFRCDINYDVTGTRVNGGRVEKAAGIYRVLYIHNGVRWEIVELTLMSAEQ